MANKSASEALDVYWQQQIESWQSSGQSQKAFCQANDLNYHRFGYWRRKFLAQAEPATHHELSHFVPVAYPAHAKASSLSLRLPNGLVLQGVTTDNLPVVYQLLSRLS